MPQGEQPAIAVCGMVERDGAVLMVRNCGLPAAGEWAFPGGTVEWGELLEVALMRHVEEETGLVVESQGLLASLDIFDRTPDWTVEHHFVINVYRCRLLRGEAKKADDASNVAWIHRSDLASYTIWHPTLYALRHAGIDVAPAVSLDVRPATPADALVVRRVLDAAFAVHRRRLPYVPGALRETETDVEADVADGSTHLGFFRDRPVATGRLSPTGEDEGYLSRLGVDAQYQGLGLGRHLLAALETEARRRGMRRTILQTSELMTGNEAFYRRCGYQVIERRENPKRHLILAKDLVAGTSQSFPP